MIYAKKIVNCNKNLQSFRHFNFGVKNYKKLESNTQICPLSTCYVKRDKRFPVVRV